MNFGMYKLQLLAKYYKFLTLQLSSLYLLPETR